MHYHTGYNQVKVGEAEVSRISIFDAYILDFLDILKAFVLVLTSRCFCLT